MTKVGLDMVKFVVQVHRADTTGWVVLRKQLRRHQVLEFFGRQPRCVVVIEACWGADLWSREIERLGHEVRLIPLAYVKPYVKHHKSDTADAETICAAAERPTIRFVSVKSEDIQATAASFGTRDFLLCQRMQFINALRDHLGKFGLVVLRGASQA